MIKSPQSSHNIEHDIEPSSLITFPAEFPIKVMGKNTPEFCGFVQEVAKQYIPQSKLLRIEEKLSKNDQYRAYTIVAVFESQQEIDTVYQVLTDNPLVLMAL